MNIAGYSIAYQTQAGAWVEAVHAFTKKAYAEKYLKDNNIDHWDILGVELPPSIKDARKKDYGLATPNTKKEETK